jgi:hypothetical protein
VTPLDLVLAVIIVVLLVALYLLWMAGPTAVAEAIAAERRTAAAVASATATEREALITQIDQLGHSNEELNRENLALRAPTPTMSAAEIEQAKASVCVHCGGVHAISCPRIKRIRFRADQTPYEVEFWPGDEWPKERVIFLEDYVANESTGVPEPPQGA